MKSFLLRIFQRWYVKYLVVLVLGVLIVGFLDDNSVWAHWRNRQRIGELQEEINSYDQRYRDDLKQIERLDRDPKAIEKIARERYFMKTDDEDIFVLDEDITPQDAAPTPQ